MQTVLIGPDEFATRIRRSMRAGRNPHRLVRCLDQIEDALERRGIRMRSYFTALRRHADRVMREKQ
jgi:hypothetical protein